MATDRQFDANRANSQLSTGPTSDAGKSECRTHALSHGLSSRLALLPDEDPAAYQKERDDWFAKYQPVGPDEIDAVERAIAASRGLRRCRAHEAVTLSRQAREAGELFDAANQQQLRNLITLLQTDPAEAAAMLKRSAVGTRYLIARWEWMRHELDTHGAWGPTHLVEALRLLGHRLDAMLSQPDARALTVCAVRSLMDVEDTIDAAEMHDELRDKLLECLGPMLSDRERATGWDFALGTLAWDLHATCDDAQAALFAHIEAQLARLRDRLPALEQDETLAREEAILEASLLDDSKTGALRLRYTNTHERCLRHALQDLERLQKNRPAPAPQPPAPNRANSDASEEEIDACEVQEILSQLPPDLAALLTPLFGALESDAPSPPPAS